MVDKLARFGISLRKFLLLIRKIPEFVKLNESILEVSGIDSWAI